MRVVVIGGGLAGLTTLHELISRGVEAEPYEANTEDNGSVERLVSRAGWPAIVFVPPHGALQKSLRSVK
jgi:uncharacterized protein with NAD-binding domain and iron-sulfur cluster